MVKLLFHAGCKTLQKYKNVTLEYGILAVLKVRHKTRRSLNTAFRTTKRASYGTQAKTERYVKQTLCGRYGPSLYKYFDIPLGLYFVIKLYV